MDVEYVHLKCRSGKEVMRAAQVCMVRVVDGSSFVALNTHIRLDDDNCEYIGGVNPSYLGAAPPLSEVTRQIREILSWSDRQPMDQQGYLVGHNLREDFSSLGLQYEEGGCFDTMDFVLFQSPKRSNARTLKSVAFEFLGREIQTPPGPHDIEQDTFAVFDLFTTIVLPSLLKTEDEFLRYHTWMLQRSMSSRSMSSLKKRSADGGGAGVVGVSSDDPEGGEEGALVTTSK